MTTPNSASGDVSGNAPGNASNSSPGSTDTSNSSSVVSGASWLTGLQDEGNRQLAAKKGWDKSNSPDVVITSYRELEGRLGKAVIPPPPQGATQDDFTRFGAAVGRPPAPDGYQFSMPQGLPSDFPYDDVSATEYKVWAHSAQLAPWQAQSLHDAFVMKQAQMQEQAKAQLAQKVQTAHTQIVNKWGSPDSEGYKRNVEFAGRALRKLGLTNVYKAHGLMTPRGEITDATLAFALATIGEGLYSEDRTHGDPGNIPRNNPWKEGEENLTEQGRILKSDRALAETLIRAAGKDPAKELFQAR